MRPALGALDRQGQHGAGPGGVPGGRERPARGQGLSDVGVRPDDVGAIRSLQGHGRTLRNRAVGDDIPEGSLFTVGVARRRDVDLDADGCAVRRLRRGGGDEGGERGGERGDEDGGDPSTSPRGGG